MNPNKTRLLFVTILFWLCFFQFSIVYADGYVIVTFGDSITLGQGAIPYSTYLQSSVGSCATVINQGLSGEKTGGGVSRIDGVLEAYLPDYVLIMEGANDAIKGIPVADLIHNLSRMIEESKKYGAIPVLSTVTPNTRNGRGLKIIPEKINPAIRTLARRHDIRLVDNYERLNKKWEKVQWDGIHPHNYGQLIMAENWFATYQEIEEEREYKQQIKVWTGIVIFLLTFVACILFFRKKARTAG